MWNVFHISCLAELTLGCVSLTAVSHGGLMCHLTSFIKGFETGCKGCWQKQYCLVAQDSTFSCPCQIGRYWGSTPTNSPGSLQCLGVCFCLAPLLRLRQPVCVSHFLSVSFSLVFPLSFALAENKFSAFHKGKKKIIPFLRCDVS